MLKLVLESLHSPIEDKKRPIAIEQQFRRFPGLFEKILGFDALQAKRGDTASTLKSSIAIPNIQEKVLQGAQKKGAESGTFPFQSGQPLLLEESQEELLRDFLGLL